MGWHCARQKAGLLAGLAGVLLPGPAVLWAQSAALLEVGKFSAARLRGHHFAAEARILPAIPIFSGQERSLRVFFLNGLLKRGGRGRNRHNSTASGPWRIR